MQLPKAVRNLSLDDYQQIRFDPGHALWARGEALFRAEFFHPGLYFQKPVTIYERKAGRGPGSVKKDFCRSGISIMEKAAGTSWITGLLKPGIQA